MKRPLATLGMALGLYLSPCLPQLTTDTCLGSPRPCASRREPIPVNLEPRFRASRYRVRPPSSSLATRAAGPAHTSHLEEVFPASSLQPSPPRQPLPLAPHHHARVSCPSTSRAAPHPHSSQPASQPAAYRAPPSRLSPPLSPGASHSRSPSAPSSSFQQGERFLLPPLTKMDSPLLVAGTGGSFHSPARSPHTWPPRQGRVGLDPGWLGLRQQLGDGGWGGGAPDWGKG